MQDISVALLLIWKLVYLKGQDTDSDACVEVTIDGRAYGTYPLSKDDTIAVSYTHLFLQHVLWLSPLWDSQEWFLYRIGGKVI